MSDATAINIKSNKIVKNTFPPNVPILTNDFMRVMFTDKNNISLAVLQFLQGNSEQVFEMLMQSKETNDDPNINNTWCGLSIHLDDNGIFTIYGITPSLESYGDELVTANWVRQLLASKGIN